MSAIKTLTAAAVVATLGLSASTLSASAQSTLTNGPAGGQPNVEASRIQDSDNGKMPARQMYRRPVRTVRSADSSRRPLTVRRTVAAAQAPVVVTPAPVGAAGPGTLITGPLGFASNVISLPFRAMNGIFPATGDIATNPLVIIGAPIHAIGDIVQVPLRVIGTPFGGTNIATY